MVPFDDKEDPRRRWLIQALAAGAFAAGFPAGDADAQSVFGTRPSRLPADRSIYRLAGDVTVNGAPASLSTRIGAGDTLRTGADSELVFVVGGNAMILRGDSQLQMEQERNAAAQFVITGLRMLTGRLLAVSRNQAISLRTVTATIGIRGTGWYVEADPELTYFCTCYGITDMVSNADPSSRDTVASRQHDKPVNITAGAAQGANIQRAGFKNHSDQELMLIETLVGRRVPFVFPGSSYNAPRRSY
jgi:hypothetical protein